MDQIGGEGVEVCERISPVWVVIPPVRYVHSRVNSGAGFDWVTEKQVSFIQEPLVEGKLWDQSELKLPPVYVGLVIQIVSRWFIVFELNPHSVIDLRVASDVSYSKVNGWVFEESIGPHATVDIEQLVEILTEAVIVFYFQIVWRLHLGVERPAIGEIEPELHLVGQFQTSPPIVVNALLDFDQRACGLR